MTESASDTTPAARYTPRRLSQSHHLPVRHLRYHLRTWGERSLVTPERPALVMLHGWMDVAASFQFVVDALQADRYIVAPDWRGFGHTRTQGVDTFWFADYLGDLDQLLDAWLPDQAVDLMGHSMGANVSLLYAGVRPARIRRLVNLEGVGVPSTPLAEVPARHARWLDSLREAPSLRPYPSLAAVARRLTLNNPRLSAERAHWLAGEWAERGSDGQYHLLADPAHKGRTPFHAREEETDAIWQAITAPTLTVTGAETDLVSNWIQDYGWDRIEARLRRIRHNQRHILPGCGHMLHHDQPEALAALVEGFLDRAG